MRRLTLPSLALLLAVAAPAAAQPGIGTCVMGETRGTTFGVEGLYGEGFTVYQWFDPATCGFCLASDGAIQVRTLEIQVFYGQPVPSTIDAVVTFLGWHGSAACPQPDESVVTLAPQAVRFDVPSTGQTLLFTLRAPILDSPLYLQPGFVRVAFARTATIKPISVGQISSPTCTSCRQYITWEAYGLVMADACQGGPLYPWVIRPRGDCIAVTATRSATWGRLKAFYK